MSNTFQKAMEQQWSTLHIDGQHEQDKSAAVGPSSATGRSAAGPAPTAGTDAVGASAAPPSHGSLLGTMVDEEGWLNSKAKEYLLSPPGQPPAAQIGHLGPTFQRPVASSARQVMLVSNAMSSSQEILGSLSNQTEWDLVGSTTTMTSASPLPSTCNDILTSPGLLLHPLLLSVAAAHTASPAAVTAGTDDAASATAGADAADAAPVEGSDKTAHAAASPEAATAEATGVPAPEENATTRLDNTHPFGRTASSINKEGEGTEGHNHDVGHAEGVVATISGACQDLLATHPLDQQWDAGSSWESVAWESDPLISAPEILGEVQQQQYQEYLSGPMQAVRARQEAGEAASTSGPAHPPLRTAHHLPGPANSHLAAGISSQSSSHQLADGPSPRPSASRLDPAARVTRATSASLPVAVTSRVVHAAPNGIPPARHRSLPDDLAAILAELPDVQEYCALAELEEQLMLQGYSTPDHNNNSPDRDNSHHPF